MAKYSRSRGNDDLLDKVMRSLTCELVMEMVNNEAKEMGLDLTTLQEPSATDVKDFLDSL